MKLKERILKMARKTGMQTPEVQVTSIEKPENAVDVSEVTQNSDYSEYLEKSAAAEAAAAARALNKSSADLIAEDFLGGMSMSNISFGNVSKK